MGLINIKSEIGKLQRVIIHRPGKEVENLTPDTLERLLFDDIPYLKIAIDEHDRFATILRENGAEVLYLEELVAEVFADSKVKNAYIEDIFNESKIYSENLKDALRLYLNDLPVDKMISKVCSGVRKKEISYKGSSLSDMIKDSYEFYLDPMPNLYFTRDPGAVVGDGLLLHTMKTLTRRRETLFLKYIHAHHNLFAKGQAPLTYNRTIPFNIEGGDVLVLSKKVLAIGCSERTSAEAIEVVAKNLLNSSETFEKVLVLEIQKKRAYMHLDTVFTMVDYDKFTVHPGIEQDLNVYEITKDAKGELVFKALGNDLEHILADALGLKEGIDLIRCGGGDTIIASREQWNDGSNTFAVAPGAVVTYERNYVSNELLDKKGVKVLTMPSSELSRGRGGPRCMSMPVSREDLTR